MRRPAARGARGAHARAIGRWDALRRRRDDQLLSVHVRRAGRHGVQLRRLLRLLLDLRNLLALHRHLRMPVAACAAASA
jgi:hypothetical protein